MNGGIKTEYKYDVTIKYTAVGNYISWISFLGIMGVGIYYLIRSVVTWNNTKSKVHTKEKYMMLGIIVAFWMFTCIDLFMQNAFSY